MGKKKREKSPVMQCCTAFAISAVEKETIKKVGKWPRQESNLDLELRKLLYYPLYDEANAISSIRQRCC